MSNYHASNNQHGADSENGDMNSSVGKFNVHKNWLWTLCYGITFLEQNYLLLFRKIVTFSLKSMHILKIPLFFSENIHSE